MLLELTIKNQDAIGGIGFEINCWCALNIWQIFNKLYNQNLKVESHGLYSGILMSKCCTSNVS